MNSQHNNYHNQQLLFLVLVSLQIIIMIIAIPFRVNEPWKKQQEVASVLPIVNSFNDGKSIYYH